MSKRPSYTDEFKQDAVKLVVEQGYRVTEAAKNLGVSESALRRWIKESETDKVVINTTGQPSFVRRQLTCPVRRQLS